MAQRIIHYAFGEIFSKQIHLKDKNRLNIEKLSEEKVVAVVNRDIKLKYKMVLK